MAKLWKAMQAQGLTDEYERHLEKDPSALSYKIPSFRIMCRGRSADVHNCSLLGGCVTANLLPEAVWLLKQRHEFDVDEVLYDDMTLLRFAVNKKKQPMVNLLLNNEASVLSENKAGETILEEVRTLLKQEPDSKTLKAIQQSLEKKWVEQRNREAKRRKTKHTSSNATASNNVGDRTWGR